MSNDLQSLLSARLENFRRNPDGSFQAACPACRAEGGDSTRSHLRIYTSGAFRCAKYAKDSAFADPIDHNRLIRAHVYQNADEALLASLESTIVDPEPKLDADKVYPEEMLSSMVPDHRYWINRGITENVLRTMEGGLHPPDTPSKMSGRFLFPIRDYPSRRIVGWTGRLVDNGNFGPKWKHLCRVSKALYPLTVTEPHIKRTRKVVLVESVGDALACFASDIWCVGVLLGLNLNSRWLGWLAGAGLDEIIISTNSDTERVNKATGAITHPGQDAAEKLKRKLVPFFGEERVRIRLPVSQKDWGDVLLKNPEELRQFKAEIEGIALPDPPSTLIL